MNVYESCPTFITQRFVLRLVQREDAPGLLRVYSDKQAQAYFNSDNCTSDFRYATLPEMQQCVDMWLWSYRQGHFVRWTILQDNKPIGTVEMFRQEDTDRGILRIDVGSRYEFEDVFDEILEVMLPELREMFGIERVLTKALPYMARRLSALYLHGFIKLSKPLVGHNGIEYTHYLSKMLLPGMPRRSRA